MSRNQQRTLVVAAVAVLSSGTVLMAGDYHVSAEQGLVCSDCHVMHFAVGGQTHGYTAPTFDDLPFAESGSSSNGYHYLLRNEVNDLCLSCHDMQTFFPDVLESNAGSNVRQAGALNRDGIAPYYQETGHTLDSLELPPGGDGTWTPPEGGLNCVSCHHPHGYGGSVTTYGPSGPYRNLSGTMVEAGNPGVTYSVGGTPDNQYDVYEATAGVYTVNNVDLNEPDQSQSAFGNWCGTCHNNFHGTNTAANIAGDGNGAEEFVRHPTAGVDIGALGGGHSSLALYIDGASFGPGNKVNYVKVMTAGGDWPVNGTQWTNPNNSSDLTPTCLSCHKGHGNQNAFGLIYMGNTGTVTEQGTVGGTYNNLCNQCHVQADPPDTPPPV